MAIGLRLVMYSSFIISNGIHIHLVKTHSQKYYTKQLAVLLYYKFEFKLELKEKKNKV